MLLSRRALIVTSLATPFIAKAQLQRINFGLNWLPQPEMGGFFESLAQGFYAQEGLEVNFILWAGGFLPWGQSFPSFRRARK
jgi:NitT/TauT family transport system substrate-binding protein